MKKRLLWITAVIVAGLAALSLRVVIEGRGALSEGDAALADRRPVDAIAAWETSARWYLPGASHVGEAYDRLRQFARTHRSIAAWRAIRSAARATRGLWQPYADELAEADQQITALAAADLDRAPIGDDAEKFAAWHAVQLAKDPRPSPGSAALAISGIAAWLAGMALLIRRPSRMHAAIAIGGLAAWALGVFTA